MEVVVGVSYRVGTGHINVGNTVEDVDLVQIHIRLGHLGAVGAEGDGHDVVLVVGKAAAWLAWPTPENLLKELSILSVKGIGGGIILVTLNPS